MASAKTTRVKFTDLRMEIFVRRALDDDNVQRLALLIESGTDLDPILVTEDFEVIDGRHRIEAYQMFAGVNDIKVKFVKVKDRAELIELAWRANSGGAKPPTVADTDHTIKMYLDMNLTQQDIAGRMGLTASYIRARASTIRSVEKRRDNLAAVRDIAENGLTVAEASDKHNVDRADVRAMISGTKSKASKTIAGEFKRKQEEIGRAYLSLSQKNRYLIEGLIDACLEGDVKYPEVVSAISAIRGKLQTQMRRLDDWDKRLRDRSNGS